MVRTSLNSFVVPIKRFFRLSTTVVEWLVVSLEIFPLSFWELQRSWRSTTAELSAVISCFITAVSSWISKVGSSNTDVRFATGGQHSKHVNIFCNKNQQIWTSSIITKPIPAARNGKDFPRLQCYALNAHSWCSHLILTYTPHRPSNYTSP